MVCTRSSNSPSNIDSCARCAKAVRKTDHAIQCDTCYRWEHTHCAQLSDNEYQFLMRTTSSRIKFSCILCDCADRRTRSLSKRRLTRKLPPARASSPIKRPDFVIDSSSDCEPPKNSKSPAKKKEKCAKKHASPLPPATTTPAPQATTSQAPPPPWNHVISKPPLPPPAPGNLPARPAPASMTIAPSTTTSKPIINRDRSVILFGVPEASQDDSQSRLQHDCASTSDIVQKLLLPTDKPIAVDQLFRLGARPGSDRPRPLKLVLDSPAAVAFVLSRSYHLKGTTYSLRPDLSPEDREKRRAAFQELRRLTENGHRDLMVVNFRVVQKRQLLRQNLTIAPLNVPSPPALV